MALQPGSFLIQMQGTNETIFASLPPATSTNATIASAFYGTDSQGTPQSATVAEDGKSLSFTVLKAFSPS